MNRIGEPMEFLRFLHSCIRQYIRETSGAIAVVFALMAPVIVGASGMALDYAQAYLVQQRLAQSLDAAALAAVASSTDEAVIRQKVLDFFEANYGDDERGFAFDPIVTINGDDVTVTGTATYTTFFLRVIGTTEITVEAKTTVEREVQGIEVVLVMDNTGSMATNNNIATLRTAASNFVYIMYGIDEEEAADISSYDEIDDLATRNSDFIKIGLVPYSTSVNVGSYGLGENPDGSSYGTAFVNNDRDLEFSLTDNTEWRGCVLANDYPSDTQDHEGPWDMYRYCRDDDDNATCDTYTSCYSTWWGGYYCNQYPRRHANYICPITPLLPLSTEPSALKASIDTMQADGWTLGNYGMAWGARVISPEYPFEEGSDYDNEYWRKAVVMMTDGINTMHQHYTTYGRTVDHDISPSDLNDRFEEVCTNLKDNGVIVYTVTFESGVDEDTKDVYERCATSEDYFHDAPTQDKLVEVFETISRELSNLRIKE